MTSTQRNLSMASWLLVLALVAAPAFSQNIVAGIDVFETLSGTGTVIDFSLDPLPADFFCPGSAPFAGAITLQGVPLVTNPPGIAGTSDTIVERLHDADLSSGSATVPVVVRAMKLSSSGTVTVFCENLGLTTFSIQACTCGAQPITQVTLKLRDFACGYGCGGFSGLLDLNVCLTFAATSGTVTAGPVSKPIQLTIDDMSWCEQAPPGGLQITQPFMVDTNCSGQADLALPCTSNFQPGWVCAPGKTCLELHADQTSCHSSFGTAEHDHCVNPVCDRQKG